MGWSAVIFGPKTAFRRHMRDGQHKLVRQPMRLALVDFKVSMLLKNIDWTFQAIVFSNHHSGSKFCRSRLDWRRLGHQKPFSKGTYSHA